MAYSVFHDKSLISYGIIKIKGNSLDDKLLDSFNKITELIEKHNVDVVILEDVFYSKNFTSTKSTLQTMGALKLAVVIKDKLCYTVQATKWRKGVIKKSQRDSMKKQAVDYVNLAYQLDLEHNTNRAKSDDDIAEAILMVEGLVWGRYDIENFTFIDEAKKT